MSDLTFAEAWAGMFRRKIGNRLVPFLGRAEYIKNKRAAAKNIHRRARDLQDIEMLTGPTKRAKRRRSR